MGKYLEQKTLAQTGKAIKALLGLQVKEATKLVGKQEQKVPIESLVIGDHVIVRPGEKIPLDGVIHKGSSDIDESMIT